MEAEACLLMMDAYLSRAMLRSCNSLPRMPSEDSKCLGMPQACVLATVDNIVGARANFDKVRLDLIEEFSTSFVPLSSLGT